MDKRKRTNPSVKAAIDALQKGDRETFLSFFADNARLFDHGSPHDFRKFVDEACGHERFTSIDKLKTTDLTCMEIFTPKPALPCPLLKER
jgi:hypothetical protein